jgi:hypothetical protein
MNSSVIESSYPLTFRKHDAKTLGEHLRLRHSVELVGMKRVGISNFLRFFLNHQDIVPHYISAEQQHLFIPVDLNNLVEFKIFPFWILTFKRLVDALDAYPNHAQLKSKISKLFLSSIQSQDLFLTVENIRQSLVEIIRADISPTIFFIRFDRLQDVATGELFANLQGLIDATGHSLAYVFTGSRSLDQVAPDVFPRRALSGFSQVLHIKPATKQDIQIIFETFEQKYQLKPSAEILQQLITLSGGHVQYLLVSLIILNEYLTKNQSVSDIEEIILHDERTTLQSEEIWESLARSEQVVLQTVTSGNKIDKDSHQEAKYLWECGILEDMKDSSTKVFSPLFEHYLHQNQKSVFTASTDMTKKEFDLYELLRKNMEQVCERDMIVEAIWPEYEEIGVSDWTIDRLVARLREKLKKNHSPYSIITVRTRGYKLVPMEIG